MDASQMEPIPITRPLLGPEEEAAAVRVLRSGWLTQGREVAAFESEFGALVKAPYACAVSSCTAALHLALVGLGIGPGDEVVTVSHSFIAAANVIRSCGATPVFVDVDRTTQGMDADLVERSINPRAKALLVVHQIGMPCDLTRLLLIAKRHNLHVVEDAACALGSEFLIDGAWEWIGRPRGSVACFSFHPRKIISCGEGGMLTTQDSGLDRKFRRLRQHGMDVSDTVRHGAAQVVFETYLEPGFNYRMTDLQAAVGREQLKRLPFILERRRALAERYRTLLAELHGVQSPPEPAWARSNWQSYAVALPDGANQKEVMQRMLDLGIATRRGIMNAHREQPYRASSHALPVSEWLQDRTILLPLFPDMTSDEQDRVVAALGEAITCGAALSTA
ncbi:MAG: DegT/DnrJ/EryC1/StrS family aminotransferase [Rhodospirillales bacterium]|jgi:dTDP-4-amino-4,6-dideoxygalactose transaminase|nr:DegT/DnrJ/EryC1/StrS family aminotransferase [Rhodospirillales bacterium]